MINHVHRGCWTFFSQNIMSPELWTGGFDGSKQFWQKTIDLARQNMILKDLRQVYEEHTCLRLFRHGTAFPLR